MQDNSHLTPGETHHTTLNLITWRRNLRGIKAAPSADQTTMDSNVFEEVWEQGSILYRPNNHELEGAIPIKMKK